MSLLEQAVRRLDEKMAIQQTKSRRTKDIFCKKKHHLGPVPDQFWPCEQYEQLHMPRFMLSCQCPDNAILFEGKFYIIRNIIIHNRDRRLICQGFMDQVSFFNYPMKYSRLGISLLNDRGNTLWKLIRMMCLPKWFSFLWEIVEISGFLFPCWNVSIFAVTKCDVTTRFVFFVCINHWLHWFAHLHQQRHERGISSSLCKADSLYVDLRYLTVVL